MVIGADGHLGRYIAKECVMSGYHTIGTSIHSKDDLTNSPELLNMDITDQNEVDNILNNHVPDAVIQSTISTDPRYCEEHPDKAWSINAEGTFNVASSCKSRNIPLMYISTDLVFSGRKGSSYYEFDSPDPTSIYGMTKLEGERIVLDANHINPVVRVSSLYGPDMERKGKDTVSLCLEAFRSGRSIELYTDRIVSPTYTPNCAHVLLTMLINGARGVYHASGPDKMSEYDIGLAISKEMGFDPDLCRPINMSARDGLIRSEMNTSLDVQKTESEFQLQMLSLKDGLHEMLKHHPSDS